MYGVSKINIETDLMMISVQDVVFPGQQSVPVSGYFCRDRRSGGYDQPERSPRHYH